MALFGGTGTGKSTLLLNMAASNLDAGTDISRSELRELGLTVRRDTRTLKATL